MSTVEEWIERLGGDRERRAQWSLGGLELYGELMDDGGRGVWLSTEPIAPEAYDALDLPDGFHRSGIGRSAHDAAVFLRPPDARADEPVTSIDVDGRTFGLVARPGAPEPGFDGVLVLPVYKWHRVLFAAGRTIEVLDLGNGWCLLPQATEARRRGHVDPASLPARTLPEGWTSRSVAVDRDLVVDLPHPARVAIFESGDVSHGPVRLDALCTGADDRQGAP